MVAYRIIGIEGGMMIAREADDEVIAAAKLLGIAALCRAALRRQ
jgi:hypothetical protein